MTFVFSDVHGCFDQYRAMLEKMRLQDTDTLYVLGDVIDRGPDGVKILRDMMVRPNVAPILGNHELTAAICLPWLLEEITDRSIAAMDETRIGALNDWLLNGGETTLRELGKLTREERGAVLDYLREMDLYAEVEAGGQSFVLIHAGLDHFSPGKPLEEYELTDFLFGRSRPAGDYYPDRIVVFGHTPTRLLRQWAEQTPEDGIFRYGNQIAIDCGCACGGRLGGLCLETMEEFYV